MIHYTLNVCAMCSAGGMGSVYLSQFPCGEFTDPPPLHFSLELLLCGPQTLCHTAVLHPRGNSGCALSLVLDAPAPLCVEQAVMDIVAL